MKPIWLICKSYLINLGTTKSSEIIWEHQLFILLFNIRNVFEDFITFGIRCQALAAKLTMIHTQNVEYVYFSPEIIAAPYFVNWVLCKLKFSYIIGERHNLTL